MEKIDLVIAQTEAYDIIILQEAPVNDEILEILKQKYGNHIFCDYAADNKSAAIITIINQCINASNVEFRKIISGRLSATSFDLDNVTYEIFNVYGPARSQSHKVKFHKILIAELENSVNFWIAGGDFNLTRDTSSQNLKSYVIRAMKLWDTKLVEDWLDVHKEFKIGDIEYTYTANNGTRSRIDKFIIPHYLKHSIREYAIEPNVFSDHDAITMKIDSKIDKIKWGRGTWKLNNSTLKEDKFLRYINIIIADKRDKRKLGDPKYILRWWDGLKQGVKEATMLYCKNRTRDEKDNIKDMFKKLRERQGKYDQETREDERIELRDEILDIKAKISESEKKIAQGARVRSRIEEVEKDERSNKYFFQKEKGRGLKKQIRCLLKKDGQETKEKNEIISMVTNFYDNLYTTEGINEKIIDENLENIDATLTKEEADSLNGVITECEIRVAIKSLKNDKSPGADGLTAEWYKTFADQIIQVLFLVLNMIQINGELSVSQKLATLSLLYKKGDSRLLKNWRPVSLLNVDYKILSKILVKRLSRFMNKLIPTTQKCAVPGRKAMDAITILDIIHNELEESGGALICLDQEKAFDRVNHTYLIKTLEKLGIHGDFLRIVKAMYKNIYTQININGKLSKQIEVTRSVRQGCPFSMLLFVAISVPLIQMIEKEDKIKGYKTRYGNEIKIISYADDNTLVITDPSSYKVIFDIYNKHAEASEAKINEEKTEILLIGNWRNRKSQFSFAKKVKPEIKVLGVMLASRPSDTSDLNWSKAIEKIEKKLPAIMERRVTIVGKVLLANSMLLSQLWHLAWVLDENNGRIKQVYQLVNKAIIGKDNGRWTIDTLTLPPEKGGLNLGNIKNKLTAFKVKQLTPFLTGKLSKEQDEIKYFLGLRAVGLIGNFTGPKRESNNNKYEKYLRILIEFSDKIKDRTNTSGIGVKELEKIFFKAPKHVLNCVFTNIYKMQDNRLKGSAYRIAANLHAIPIKEICPACGINIRDRHFFLRKNHIFLNCPNLEKLRDETRAWMDTVSNQGQEPFEYSDNMAIYHNQLNPKQQIIIAIQNKEIWKQYCNTWFGKKIEIDQLEIRIEQEVRFRLQHGLL